MNLTIKFSLILLRSIATVNNTNNTTNTKIIIITEEEVICTVQTVLQYILGPYSTF